MHNQEIDVPVGRYEEFISLTRVYTIHPATIDCPGALSGVFTLAELDVTKLREARAALLENWKEEGFLGNQQ